jgi:hypothetical protein
MDRLYQRKSVQSKIEKHQEELDFLEEQEQEIRGRINNSDQNSISDPNSKFFPRKLSVKS